ncbi:MAG: DDE-type integrase/transposase/recombinase [Candidatus Helarchaeota archaeon]
MSIISVLQNVEVKIPFQVSENFSVWDEGKEKYHTIEIKFQILCPNCSSKDICKFGIDYNHSKHPQRYKCNLCGDTFYAHTSKIFIDKIKELFADILQNRGAEGEGVKFIAEKYGVSESQISKIYKLVRNRIIKKIKAVPSEHPLSDVLIMDEKFLKICGKKKLLIITVDMNGMILSFRLSKNRNSKTIKTVLKKAIKVNGKVPEIIVTDGFSSYRKVVRSYYPHTIHVRHIHKPIYNRITIEYLSTGKDGKEKLVTLHTTNDIFTRTGTNYGVLEVKDNKKKGRQEKEA